MKLLITGFDAFGKDDYNPSYEALKALPDTIKGISIKKIQLPTKYIDASRIIIDYLSENDVDYVFLCGQAAGRKEITLEKYALNIMNSTINDNAQYMPYDITIVNGGEIAYETSLNLEKMSKYMNKKDIETKISYHAGTFVCNSTYYSLLHTIETMNLDTKGLFIHVPIIESQQKNYDKELPTVTLKHITDALYASIEFISENI